MRTISHVNPYVGMGTMDFITETLDIYAVLHRDRKESLVDYSDPLAKEQRAVVTA